MSEIVVLKTASGTVTWLGRKYPYDTRDGYRWKVVEESVVV